MEKNATYDSLQNDTKAIEQELKSQRELIESIRQEQEKSIANEYTLEDNIRRAIKDTSVLPSQFREEREAALKAYKEIDEAEKQGFFATVVTPTVGITSTDDVSSTVDVSPTVGAGPADAGR